MRTTHKVLIAAAAAAVMAASAGASAQGFGPCGGGPGYGPGAMWGGGPGYGPRAMWGGGTDYGPRAMRGGGAGYGPGAMRGGPRGPGAAAGPESNADARLAYLKNELKLTSSQNAAWSAYEAAMKQQASSMQALRDTMFKSENATDRVALHAAHAKQRAAGVEAMSAALTNLYAVLTPEQKTIADANVGGRFMAMGPRGPGRFR